MTTFTLFVASKPAGVATVNENVSHGAVDGSQSELSATGTTKGPAVYARLEFVGEIVPDAGVAARAVDATESVSATSKARIASSAIRDASIGFPPGLGARAYELSLRG